MATIIMGTTMAAISPSLFCELGAGWAPSVVDEMVLPSVDTEVELGEVGVGDVEVGFGVVSLVVVGGLDDVTVGLVVVDLVEKTVDDNVVVTFVVDDGVLDGVVDWVVDDPLVDTAAVVVVGLGGLVLPVVVP